MFKRTPCIYKITNLIDRKIYIGQTSRDFEERKRNHLSRLRRGVHDNIYLQSSWNKYGEFNFLFEIIQECEIEQLDELERFWISFFDATNKTYGYNFETGGSNNKRLDHETRSKLGKAVILTNTKERFVSATAGAQKYGLSQGSVSSCCRGLLRSAGKLPNGEYSVWVFEEDYDASKDYTFKRHSGSHNPRAKKVVCLTTNEQFETMRQAGEHFKIKSYLKISEVCRGKREHCGALLDGTKLRWAYAN